MESGRIREVRRSPIVRSGFTERLIIRRSATKGIDQIDPFFQDPDLTSRRPADLKEVRSTASRVSPVGKFRQNWIERTSQLACPVQQRVPAEPNRAMGLDEAGRWSVPPVSGFRESLVLCGDKASSTQYLQLKRSGIDLGPEGTAGYEALADALVGGSPFRAVHGVPLHRCGERRSNLQTFWTQLQVSSKHMESMRSRQWRLKGRRGPAP